MNGQDLSYLNELRDEGPVVHDILETANGGIVAIECPSCKRVYMATFISGQHSKWQDCPHCMNSRVSFTGKGGMRVEKRAGADEPATDKGGLNS